MCAIDKLNEFAINQKEELDDDEKLVLKSIEDNENGKIGEIYKKYQENNGQSTYKTFSRKVERLEKGKYISLDKTNGGKGGNTTYINTNKYKDKSLGEFWKV